MDEPFEKIGTSSADSTLNNSSSSNGSQTQPEPSPKPATSSRSALDSQPIQPQPSTSSGRRALESAPANADEDDDDDDFEDETLVERLVGLTEMFPDWFRSGVSTATCGSLGGVATLYGWSRSVCWVVFSSAVILMAPIAFENERSSVEEMQKQHQRQILLGPGANMPGPGGMSAPPPPMPPLAQAQR